MTKQQLIEDIFHVIRMEQTCIGDDFISEGCDEPSMDITIACDDEFSTWAYQTGDNSFTGSCYLLPHWAVGTILRSSDSNHMRELSEYLVSQLLELIPDKTYDTLVSS